MNPLESLLAALGVLLATSLAALLLARLGRVTQWLAVLGVVLGSGVGLTGALRALAGAPSTDLSAPWRVPGGVLILGVDSLSAFFLVPLLAFAPLAAVFGRAYLARPGAAARTGARTAAGSGLLGLLVAAMALVLLARHALLFLVAWEAMTLLAYLLIATDHGEAEVRRASFTYLVASHVGVLALIGLFLALGSHVAGALDFASFQRLAGLPLATASGLLALAGVGFGIKAGMPGLHVWLPEAHAAAPSHVSALMSGVLVKLGVYGLLRVTTWLPVPEAAGVALMALGLAGALGGITLALQQRDLKRVLAYSTIENVGIVLLGLGLGFWGRSHGEPALAALGFAGGLLHVWNHFAIKGLLFLGAGSVLRATNTKDLERLGGLLRRMPLTGGAIVVGAAAIAGLPPLNGFVGEWLIYRGLASASLEPASVWGLAAMAGIAAMALVGGLAAICFVRVVGIALLGEPRSEGSRRAHEGARAIAGPLVLLAATCVALSLAAPASGDAAASLLRELTGVSDAGSRARSALAPLAALNAGLFGALLAAALLFRRRVRAAASDDTWGCGYTAAGSRMQYTATSFGGLLAGRLLPAWLRPSALEVRPRGIFPGAASWSARHADPLTRALYEPLLSRFGDRFSRLRWLQQGSLHIYLVYIAGIVILGMLWSALRGWWIG